MGILSIDLVMVLFCVPILKFWHELCAAMLYGYVNIIVKSTSFSMGFHDLGGLNRLVWPL